MWDLIVSVPDHCLSFYFAIYDITFFLRMRSFLLKERTFVFLFAIFHPCLVKWHCFVSFLLCEMSLFLFLPGLVP